MERPTAEGAGRVGSPASTEAAEPARRRAPGLLRTAVMAALVERPGHGYELTNRLKRRMGPMLDADLRRVYEALEQLEKDGLASSVQAEAPGSPHRRRRVFSITPHGLRVHAGWMRERQSPPLVRTDIYALVAFSDPKEAAQLLAKLHEYELDCLEVQERAIEVEVERASWRSRMIGMTRAAVVEQMQAELRWIGRVRREIEEYAAEAS